MRTRQQVAVLGLGRFGLAVARELTRLGHDVLAVDISPQTIQELSEDVTHAVQAHITDREALEDLGLSNFDVAIIGVSSDLEVSVLATVLLQRIGVRRILAKAANELHGTILRQVGASHTVYPEVETAVRVAHSFAAAGVEGYLDVAPGYGLARVRVAGLLVSKTLGEIDLRRAYGLTVVALARKGEVTLNPHPSEKLQAGDDLIVAGLDRDLERLPANTTAS